MKTMAACSPDVILARQKDEEMVYVKDFVEFLSRNIGDWSESDAGWCCDQLKERIATIDAKDAEIAKLRQQVETLRDVVAFAIPIVTKWCWYQGDSQELQLKYIAPLDAALKSTEPKEVKS